MKWFMAPLGSSPPRCLVRDGRFVDDWSATWIPLTPTEPVVMFYKNGSLVLSYLPEILAGECVMVGCESEDRTTRKIFDVVVGNWSGAAFILKGWTLYLAGMVACTSSRSELPVRDFFSLGKGVKV